MTAWNLVSKVIEQRERDASYGSIGVSEATSEFAILELCSYGRADAEAAGADLGTAGAPAVGIRDTSAGRELLALAITDIFSTGVVGSEGHCGDGD